MFPSEEGVIEMERERERQRRIRLGREKVAEGINGFEFLSDPSPNILANKQTNEQKNERSRAPGNIP